uniref:SAC domain-containing protein n=2 Tax=Palpitomonas bilix TaxID=652834 RepID=A0A7S3G9Q0_9EUKA|mmetsp:Transcript_33539/g.85821  ORF Transcript_33539/g.85821 Transcript_33539/m.85821 type:complete len:419 (+) Transcript_33539:262-1518(+)
MAAAGIAAVLQSATAKLICGFVEANMDVQVGDKTINLYLVSRRSVKRAGTRLHRRGVDDNGDVANFVETEMITEMGSGDKKVVNAFLQTRGSIPIIWKQDPNMKWNPTPKRDGSDEKDHSLFSTHMKDTVRAYGKQVIIDLIDQKGKELIIGDAFRQNVDKLGSEDVRYVDFDFHKRCKKMNYTPLNELVDEVKEEFIQQGQFTLRGGKVDNVQKGVFRTNCKDCLDRTNVVQTKFARVNLATQLHVSGMLDAAHGIHDEPALEKVFKMMWADNADAISTQYSGTGALKNDFTRTGKRTKKGLLQDGVNSVTRYVLNNFYDGQRQDMYDLFLGNYVVPDQSSSPFSPVGGPQMLMMWFAAVLGLSLLLFTVTSQQAEASGSSFPFNVLPAFTAIGVFVVAMFGAFKVGSLFVDKPHLS